MFRNFLSSCSAFLLKVTNSVILIVVALLGLITFSAFLYSATEGKGLGHSFWWAVVTASTVGYGDTYPATTTGRFIAGLLIACVVLLILPLITAHFASKLIVDHDAFKHEEQEEIKNTLREILALLREKDALSQREEVVDRIVLTDPEAVEMYKKLKGQLEEGGFSVGQN